MREKCHLHQPGSKCDHRGTSEARERERDRGKISGAADMHIPNRTPAESAETSKDKD